tara:strand:+ start:17160 stop:17744 length:585 start_codon:yes stop_codon:yes gene_type:complete
MPKALLAYYLAFLVLGFVWPSLRIWVRQRINPFVLSFKDDAHGVVSKSFSLVTIVLLCALIAALRYPPEAFGPLIWAESATLRMAGWTFLGTSSLAMFVAQAQMGRAWRIGFDQGARPELMTGGLFSRSRNPIFLSMRVNLIGLFLVWPNAVTLAALLLGEVMLQAQVRMEETYLSEKLGDEYATYLRQTPRWL